MRMNRLASTDAAQVVNTYDEARLAQVLYLYGELKQSRRMAAALVKARASLSFANTMSIYFSTRLWKNASLDSTTL